MKNIVLTAVLCCCVVFWIVSLRASKTIKTRKWTFSPPPSRLVYLIQAGSCLPDSLSSVEALGNSTTCGCDVLVLSYKQMCTDPPPAHVEYISACSPTSWNEGRNLLLEVARKRSEKYLFYIFMDDDIILRGRSKGRPTKHPGWRGFENFLRQIQPAVGAVDTNHNNMVANTNKARQSQGCGFKRSQGYIPAIHFDGALNAFHYQAVEYILPYPLNFDNISWWFSQTYVRVKSKVIFPGQVVLHCGSFATNQMSRPYPRKYVTESDLQDIVEMVQADFPRIYQNASLLLEWKKYGLQHPNKSPVTCLPPPRPKKPIKPFAYIENNGYILIWRCLVMQWKLQNLNVY